MNVHDCIRCNNPINYDDTDWCDVCDMSVFDDRMIKQNNMLTIKNPQQLIGQEYSDWLKVISAKENQWYYEFTLANKEMSQIETILLHRKQTENGCYIMEYNNKTLWLNKDEFDTMDKIIICMQTI
jgi:hypothetical protein